MPTYTCACAKDRLQPDQKRRIAEVITRIHAEVTGAPRYFAQVLFQPVIPGDWFMGGAPLGHDHIFVHGQIRDGRSAKEKSALIKRIAEEIAAATGFEHKAVWVYITEIPARQMIEFGHVLPQAGDEHAWNEALPEDDRRWLQTIGG